MNWETRAGALAARVTDPDSRWRSPVAGVPRHALVPRWWERVDGRWTLRDGADDPGAWADAAYADTSLVTRVGSLHADHATHDDHPEGAPTSSATLPSLVVAMLRHGRIGDGLDLLDLGTGAGGLTAYACARLGSRHVTSLDVDPYLTAVAADRLARLGIRPTFLTSDATEEVPGSYDRIVATVGMPPGPGLRPVLGALREGGRLVTALARTTLILTGWKQPDGEVVGRVERDWAGFMLTRSGDDYPPALTVLSALARNADGDDVSTGRYPVVNVAEAWELRSMLEVVAPDVESGYETSGRTRTVCLTHPDGSWARATADWTDPPEVHQSGPQRLWDTVERIRTWQLAEGALPLYGATARVTPDGVVHLSRGRWRASLGQSTV
ncbi:methyltransferase domain-containing protein [Streptomyces sp. JNUCC 64]